MPGQRRLVHPLTGTVDAARAEAVVTSYGALILSCEHATNAVPARYAHCFDSPAAQSALSSHRGWDIGARTVARKLGRHLHCPVFEARATRLLVDCNRTRRHRQLFSEFSRSLPPERKERVLRDYYLPYVKQVYDRVEHLLRQHDAVIHLSVHSFTPELDGHVRNANIGLLYDPQRAGEREFCRTLRQALGAHSPGERVRLNYPYRGVGDGLITSLRRQHPAKRYVGIELEVNQGSLTTDARRIIATLVDGISDVLDRARRD